MKHAAYRPWFWEEAPFFRVLPPLVLAICCYDQGWYTGNGTFVPYTAALVCLVCLAYVSLVKTQRPVVVWLRFVLLQCLVFWIGLLSCRVSDITSRQDWFGHHTDSTVAYTVRISREPEEKSRTWKLSVETTGMLQEGAYHSLTGKAFVYLYKTGSMPAFHTGDEILLPGNWQPVESSNDPFAFDYRRYAARNGIYYQQFLSEDDVCLFRKAGPMDAGVISYVHNWCMRQLVHYLPDRATLGIMQAMLIGDEMNLDPELRQAYSETGIIHVVAISGGHVMMFFMIISAMLFWVKHKRHRWIKYVVALPLVWFYVLVSGAPPSAVRAVIMFSVLALGIAMDKEHNALNQLLATAFVLLCFEPMWLFSVGFQLSFIAVLSLILFYRPIYNLWPQTNRMSRVLWETVCASLAAEVLVAPLVIYYFHLFPLSFILANVIAWLLMGLVLVAGIFLIAVSWIPLIADTIAGAITFAVIWFNKMIYLLQAGNPEALRHLVLTPLSLCALYVVIGCGAVLLMRSYRAALWGGVVSLCVLMLLLCIEEQKALQQHRLVVFYSAGHTVVERIAGKHHFIPAAVNTDNSFYALDAANTGWHAWKRETLAAAPFIFDINGKTVFILKDPLPAVTDTSFPIHTLLVDQPLRQLSFTAVQQIFQPVEVVVCGRQYRGEVERWREECAERGIVVHVVQTDGAFVLE